MGLLFPCSFCFVLQILRTSWRTSPSLFCVCGPFMFAMFVLKFLAEHLFASLCDWKNKLNLSSPNLQWVHVSSPDRMSMRNSCLTSPLLQFLWNVCQTGWQCQEDPTAAFEVVFDCHPLCIILVQCCWNVGIMFADLTELVAHNWWKTCYNYILFQEQGKSTSQKSALTMPSMIETGTSTTNTTLLIWVQSNK